MTSQRSNCFLAAVHRKNAYGWKNISLHHLVRFRNGQDYSDIEDPDGRIPVYGSGGVFSSANSYLYDGESILFGRKGTIDKPLYVTGKFWAIDTMFYTILSPRVVGRWLYYWATTIPFGLYSTNTALPSMTSGTLGKLRVNLPPLPEQRAIANFLDRETAKIDALIAKQTELIELLMERRTAAIAAAIYENERQNTWPSLQIRRIAKIRNGGTPKANEEYWDGEIPFITPIDLRSCHGKHVTSTERYITEEGAQSGSTISDGGVIISNRAPIGYVSIIENRSAFNQGCKVLEPQNMHLKFLMYALIGATPILQALGQGTTFMELSTQSLASFHIPFPPFAVQHTIADHLDCETARIDTLITKAEELITLSQERRAALITAAVTGQIDVRNKEN